MDKKGKPTTERKEKKVEELKAGEVERRIAPVTSSLDTDNPDGDGIITTRVKPRYR